MVCMKLWCVWRLRIRNTREVRRSWGTDRLVHPQCTGWKITWLIRYRHSKNQSIFTNLAVPSVAHFSSISFPKKLFPLSISQNQCSSNHSDLFHFSICAMPVHFSICACAVSSKKHDGRQCRQTKKHAVRLFWRTLSQVPTLKALVEVIAKSLAT